MLTPAAAAVFTAPNPDSADSPGWNFHDTYFVTIKAREARRAWASTSATWKVAAQRRRAPQLAGQAVPVPDGRSDPNPTLDVHQQRQRHDDDHLHPVARGQRQQLRDRYGRVAGARKSHTFSNLTGSDKAEFVITNGDGATVYDFFLDYICAKAGHPVGLRLARADRR